MWRYRLCRYVSFKAMKFSMKPLVPLCFAISLLVTVTASPSYSADYVIDTDGGHAAINFKFKHLGISWLTGEFRNFEGFFSYDPENVEASSIHVDIDVTSLDSNHARRDRHILAERYLNAESFPEASFVSTSVEDKGHGNMKVLGNLTLHGITREIAIDATEVGSGKDPWGGYRVGLEGTTTLDMRDFGYESFGPTHLVEMLLYVEGMDSAKKQR